MLVADTNVISEPLRSSPNPRVLEWLAAHHAELAITSITIGELMYGALRLPHGRRREALVAAIDQLMTSAGARVLDFDQSAAVQYAHLRASRESKGLTISVEDNMIAAICLASGCNQATRNVKGFEDAGITLHDPWDGD